MLIWTTLGHFWTILGTFGSLSKEKDDDDDDDGEIDLMPQPVLGLLPLSLLFPPMSLKVAMVEDNSPARWYRGDHGELDYVDDHHHDIGVSSRLKCDHIISWQHLDWVEMSPQSERVKSTQPHRRVNYHSSGLLVESTDNLCFLWVKGVKSTHGWIIMGWFIGEKGWDGSDPSCHWGRNCITLPQL